MEATLYHTTQAASLSLCCVLSLFTCGPSELFSVLEKVLTTDPIECTDKWRKYRETIGLAAGCSVSIETHVCSMKAHSKIRTFDELQNEPKKVRMLPASSDGTLTLPSAGRRFHYSCIDQ